MCGRGADLAGVEGDAAARFGEAVANAADDRHLEPVEDPNGAEAITISQWNLDYGKRSSRAGMRVSIVPV